MTIWEFKSGSNDFSPLVPSNDEDIFNNVYRIDGKPKHWNTPPKIEVFVEKNKKKQKPTADIGYLLPGTVILNRKAYAALKDFLLKFGELLDMDCNGEIYYLYNVTNLISCIDVANSKMAGKSVIKEVFLSEAIPQTAQIFKDQRKVASTIYLSQAAKDILEQLITAALLTGGRFEIAGQKAY